MENDDTEEKQEQNVYDILVVAFSSSLLS